MPKVIPLALRVQDHRPELEHHEGLAIPTDPSEVKRTGPGVSSLTRIAINSITGASRMIASSETTMWTVRFKKPEKPAAEATASSRLI